MGKNKIKLSRVICTISIASMAFFMTACSAKGMARAALDKGGEIIKEKIDEDYRKKDEECRKVLEERAELYGIDLDIWYGGFSEQDYGYDSEYYWDDEEILSRYAQHLVDGAREEDKSAEKFYEITGIDEDTAIAIRSRVIQTYPSFNIEEPDKNEHTYTFIPGDTIMHCEKFIIGDEECPIEAGVYNVDLPDDHGIIHITDSNDNTIYRLDAKYRYGHTDEIYNYEMLPVKVELKKGNIIYMTNATSTFDSCVE